MNKTRIYTDEEIKVLLSNPNVVRIRNKSQILYKNSGSCIKVVGI